jgi:hypothetical protein
VSAVAGRLARRFGAGLAPGLLLLAACEPEPPPDERPVSGVTAAWDATLGGGFWSAPFPSDLRIRQPRRVEGARTDWRGFPNPSGNELLDLYVEFATRELTGWGLNSPIWLPFSDELKLPDWTEGAVRASGRCEGPVRILDVDPASPAFGTCVPARWDWIEGDTQDPYVAPHTVVVAPYWGFPLRSGTRYAVYVVDVQDPAGDWLEGPPSLQAALAGDPAAPAPLAGLFAPLAEALAADPSAGGGFGASDGGRWIASATVFTTQDATRELGRFAEFIHNDADFPAWTGELAPIAPGHPEFQQDYELWDGAYIARNFQRGEIPYAAEGGGFVVDEAGFPVSQLEERIPFAIGLPRITFEQPAAGWPVILHAHGTGGDRWSHLTGGELGPHRLAASRGFLSVGIPQPFHEERWPEGTDLAIDLYSFNYFNPDAGRTTFRQGALDSVAAVKFIRENMAAGGPIAETFPQLRVDPDRIFFVGHSQGGLTGALALPFLDEVQGWVLSGAGGGLSITMMQREDPLVIRDALVTALEAPQGTELSVTHPLLGLVQTIAEVTDPINYASGWFAEAARSPASVLLTEGLLDAQTPADTSEALAVAAQLPIAEPFRERGIFGLELRGIEDRETPYSGNAMTPAGVAITSGLAQFDADHFAIFTQGEAGLLWANFLYSQVRDGPPGELGAEFP